MKKNIVLIGYMGCGKSSIGRSLAALLQMNYVDLDDYIEDQEKQSIAQIFNDKGEVYFRKAETTALQTCLTALENTIISLGGGTPCFGNNMDTITNDQNSSSIYLQTSVPELSKRLFTQKDKRPLISYIKSTPELEEFVGKHLFERNTFYMKAKHIVKTDDKTLQQVVDEINDLIL